MPAYACFDLLMTALHTIFFKLETFVSGVRYKVDQLSKSSLTGIIISLSNYWQVH